MSETSVKMGWARQQYGRDRYDASYALADLPYFLVELGVDEAGYKRMPYSVRMKVLRLLAELDAKAVYYEHELADAKAAAPVQEAPKPTAAMTALKAEVPQLRAKRDALLEPYLTEEAKAKLAARRAQAEARQPATV